MATQYTFDHHQQVKLEYLLSLPKDYSPDAGKRWPLILFLHGAGERGSDLSKVAKHGPPKEVTEGAEFPFIVVSPQCPEGQIWSADVLLNLLEETRRTRAVDSSRVYLTGLSMGGYGTWDLGLAHPEQFAAIVPICGGGELINVLLLTPEKRAALTTLGVWAFHGGKDPVVPLAETQRMVDFMKHLGCQDVQFTVYPEAGHDAWTETYVNPQLYAWLLQHQR